MLIRKPCNMICWLLLVFNNGEINFLIFLQILGHIKTPPYLFL